MRLLSFLLAMFFVLATLAACAPAEQSRGDVSERPIRVVATTSMVADLVREIGGDRVEVDGLMGPGVDPHLYKAKASDVTRMGGADVIFYNGLHLEGKMTELFEQMQARDIRTVAVAERISEDQLLGSPTYQGNYDPHVWMDVSLWQNAAEVAEDALKAMDPAHAATYEANASSYATQLDSLDQYVRTRVAELPEGRRVLVTAHDAFEYFGRAYDVEVRGLQGISTATEAGTADVQDLAAFIAERQVPAIFVESSVSSRNLEAVQAAVRARGFDVKIGGNLYSDALGNPGTPDGTYLGMIRHNVDTIVDALKADVPVAAN